MAGGLEQLVSDAEAIAAISEPPADTRAYFRGRCIDTFPEQVVAANWDSLVFDVGSDALRRVPMMEPMRDPCPCGYLVRRVRKRCRAAPAARDLTERPGRRHGRT